MTSFDVLEGFTETIRSQVRPHFESETWYLLDTFPTRSAAAHYIASLKFPGLSSSFLGYKIVERVDNHRSVGLK